MSRLFFDVSDLRHQLANGRPPSGIQRVAAMLAGAMMARAAADATAGGEVYLAYLDRARQDYRALPVPAGVGQAGVACTLGFAGTGGAGSVLPTLGKYVDDPGRRRFHMLRRDLAAALGSERPFRRHGSSRAAWQAARSAGLPPPGTGDAARDSLAFRELAAPGDRLVVLDAAWNSLHVAEAHRAARALGMEVWILVHDLCPVTDPSFFPAPLARRFEAWLAASRDMATRYLANSEATAADLEAYLARKGGGPPVSVLPLAQAPLPTHDDRATTGPGAGAELGAILARPFVLAVGTREIRKNLWGLAQAWDRLRARPELDLPRVVVAGRPGWLNHEFDALMDASGRLGGWISVLDGPSDTILDRLYRGCLFTACVSFKEGWGLPVGESLAYGKTAVASATSSLPEVGGDMVEYCEPTSVASIERACLRLVADTDHRHLLERRIAEATLRSWHDVAEDLAALLASA